VIKLIIDLVDLLGFHLCHFVFKIYLETLSTNFGFSAVAETSVKESQMSMDLVVGGNDNVSNTVVVETTQIPLPSATR